jgi:hypothetical protein
VNAPAVVMPAAARQRRWSTALIALLVTVGSALAFALLWLDAGDREPVLALANTVPAGQVIEAGDLTVVRVSADPQLRLVGSGDRDEVIGQTAAVDLLAGSLLTEGQLGDHSELIDAGEAVVGVTLPRGEVPIGTLGVGDRVLVVRTAASIAQEGRASLLTSGRVFAVDELDDASGSVRVSVVVDAEVAPDVASANALDQVRLALVPAEAG